MHYFYQFTAMISDKEHTRISKFLSLVLRHQPGKIDLTPDKNGWTNTGELIANMNKHGFPLTADMLDHIVAVNNKKRFSFNENKTLIRASQGHSIDVDLNLISSIPPPVLYHGTGEKPVNSILKTGLVKGSRHHVHLSRDIETAILVGKRKGKPKIFIIAAEQMCRDGFCFYLSDNQVWLTDRVPPVYLQLKED